MSAPFLRASAAQAELLLNVDLRPLLTLLMQAPQTTSAAARHLGLSLGRAHYLIRKLELGGLARVVQAVPRAGRAVKHYEVPAPWFIPFEVTRAGTLEESVAAQILPRTQRIVEHAVRVTQEHIGSGQGYWMSADSLTIGDASGPAGALWLSDEPFLLSMGLLRLTRADAVAFKRRLLDVVREFESRDVPTEAPYAAALMLVRGDIE